MSDDALKLRIGELLLPVFRKMAAWLNENAAKLARMLTRIRGSVARREWRTAQGSARFLAHHPDLAEFDGWLDRWYPDPVAH